MKGARSQAALMRAVRVCTSLMCAVRVCTSLTRSVPIRAALLPTSAIVVALLAGCGDDTAPGEPFFPADYRGTYVEVRNCRQSADHDLHMIRVLADPLAVGPYTTRDAGIPEGAVLVKEEYDFGDFDCTGPIVKFTASRRLAPESAPDDLDWEWQRLDPSREVVFEESPRCVACHTGCEPPDGYEGTCAVP
jgi:hypothetical protein